jgi:hypothetical protein
VLFPVFASTCVLYAASLFYGYLHLQTRGSWSAPLDDVFIHFDYARATARGYPFQWSEGNGFSSGNTSLLYPFTLAIGYFAGFRSLDLMAWAAFVACVSTLVFLVVCGRMFEGLGRWAKYLVPPAVMSLGALDWSLFSGMENAFHLGVWAVMLLPTLVLVARSGDANVARRCGWIAGGAGVLLYATRPESVVNIAAFAVYGALAARRSFGTRGAVETLLRVGAPGAFAALGQAVANRVFTGEWAASGAIVKLALNNPYMTGEEKLDEWFFHLKYVVLRNTQHHFADALPWGWLVPLVALIPLASPKTRAAALLLWAQVVGWLLLVSLNGQVRWQNERYTMSAIAWLFVLAAMGLAVLAAPATQLVTRRARGLWLGRLALACAFAFVYWLHQAPNMRDQIWFFGRASRNIRDQHVVAGKVLAGLKARRVLVGDAGALLYASDMPGLDLIGLGGYHDLPFARAGVHGLGASLELIERIAPDDRPDVMAIYPTWWGDLPVMFGKRLVSVPVVGNVICGGAEKVIYKADWSALDRAGQPRSLREGERVLDELDVADLISEKAHDYAFPRPGMGFVAFRVLPESTLGGSARRAELPPQTPESTLGGSARRAEPPPQTPESTLGESARRAGLPPETPEAEQRTRELFDAGRVIPGGASERAVLRAPRGPGRLVVRTVVSRPAAAEVRADGRLLGRIVARVDPTWTEATLDLPADLPERFTLTLTAVAGEWMSYHVWVVEGGAGSSMAQPPGG